MSFILEFFIKSHAHFSAQTQSDLLYDIQKMTLQRRLYRIYLVFFFFAFYDILRLRNCFFFDAEPESLEGRLYIQGVKLKIIRMSSLKVHSLPGAL